MIQIDVGILGAVIGGAFGIGVALGVLLGRFSAPKWLRCGACGHFGLAQNSRPPERLEFADLIAGARRRCNVETRPPSKPGGAA
jgi:hypothetical protein